MSQIAMIAKFTCIDGKRDDLYAGLAPMMDHVDSEQGTLLYQLLEDPNDANVAYMYELYADNEALQAHSTSDVMKQIMNAFGGILAGRPELTMLTPVRGKGL
jgi:quinol monooxygenase YgiN